jgi:nucleoside 2-deoxyribosyltransferase
MKYYIATSLSRMAAHNSVRDALQMLGHEIAYDWTLHGSVKSTSKARLREVAILELGGIANAEFVVVLLPGGKGTHLELGFALAKGKKVFLHSEDSTVFELGPQTNAFYHHPDVTCLSCPLSELADTVHKLSFGPEALVSMPEFPDN